MRKPVWTSRSNMGATSSIKFSSFAINSVPSVPESVIPRFVAIRRPSASSMSRTSASMSRESTIASDSPASRFWRSTWTADGSDVDRTSSQSALSNVSTPGRSLSVSAISDRTDGGIVIRPYRRGGDYANLVEKVRRDSSPLWCYSRSGIASFNAVLSFGRLA